METGLAREKKLPDELEKKFTETGFVESSDEDDQSGDISCWRECEERDCFLERERESER